MQLPKKSHMDAALWVMRYLKSASGMVVLMKRGVVDTLTGLAACPMTRRSVSGYAIKFGDSLVS